LVARAPRRDSAGNRSACEGDFPRERCFRGAV
jgi:hypothetical protein